MSRSRLRDYVPIRIDVDHIPARRLTDTAIASLLAEAAVDLASARTERAAAKVALRLAGLARYLGWLA